MVLVLHEAEPLDETTDTLDFVVNKGSLMGDLVKSSLMGEFVRGSLMGGLVRGLLMSSLVKGSLMEGLVICSSTGSLVKMGICTSVRSLLMSSLVGAPGDFFVMGDTSAGKMMNVTPVVEEVDVQEVDVWQY